MSARATHQSAVATTGDAVTHHLERVSRERRLTLPAIAVCGVAFGIASAVIMPWGPVTAGQGLIAITLAFALGTASGWLWRSRWGRLLALVAFGVAFEIARAGTPGPTVGAVRVDTAFGIIALLLSRGLHLFLVAPPLFAGGGLGVRLRARAEAAAGPSGPGTRRGSVASWLPTAIGLVLTLALAALVAWPPSTPPILGTDGQPIPGSIAELATVRLGGADQSVMIRAADPDMPVLLYLSGGPGQSDLALSRVLAEGWTHDFVFVDWDQRGNGKSYPALDPVESLTLEQAIADTIELSEYLLERFDEPKIYLMGESWGSVLGVLAVQRRPDLYYAWIGSGQMVSIHETDARIYADLRAYAARIGDVALAAKLDEIGEPPYRDIPWSNGLVLTWYDYLYGDYMPSEGYLARGAASGLDNFGMLGSEYSLIEKANVLRGLIDTFAILNPQLQEIDFRRDVQRLEVPVYVLDGLAELHGRRDLMLEWFTDLEAPIKLRVEYAGAAHSVAFEQADEVQRLLTGTIVPATYGR